MKPIFLITCMAFALQAHAVISGDVALMNQEECRGALHLNMEFYIATNSMNDVERRAYFKKFRQEVIDRGLPAPSPPPPPESPINLALAKCAFPT